jgi:nitrite reductase/ring-hydroxylating ferredoxin subunit
MTATLVVSPEERVPLAFVLAVEIGHLQGGTAEHREIAQGLRELYSALFDAPEGPVRLEFANDELYQVGIRLYADASELEEWWLDHRASRRVIGEPAPFPDENFGRAVARFFPEAITDPEHFDFESLRPHFGSLARKIDLAMIEFVPRARALYNKEREEIIRRTRRQQREREEQRARRYSLHPEREMWRPAVRVTDLGIGEMTDVEIEGRTIVVARTGEGFHAIDAACTHIPALATLANLARGTLDLSKNCVTCPWHGSQFDLRTGKVVRQPYAPEFNREHFFAGRLTGVLDPKKTATDTRVYPTKVVGEIVMVNVA